jgi:hypothetical protein
LHYSAAGGKVRGGRGGPTGNCYMTPPLPIQHPQTYQPYPQYYQAFPPLPAGLGPQPFMYGYYHPPAPTYMDQPPLPVGPAPDVAHPQEPPPLTEGPPPDDNPPLPPPPDTTDWNLLMSYEFFFDGVLGGLQ